MSSSNSLGLLRYKIRYDHTIGKLHCTVVECKNLPKTDVFGKTDPYVKVFLMPGNHADLKTKSFKKNQNPVFNDEFSFVIDVDNAQKKTIVFQVFDKDMVGKDDATGEVQVPLWLVDMMVDTDKTEILEKPTTDKNKKPILKQKRPNATVRSSSISSTASSVRESTFDVSGDHKHSTYGGGGLHSSSVSEVTQRSSNGQGFHSSSGGHGFHSSHSSSATTVISNTGGRRDSSSSSSGENTPSRRPISQVQDHGVSLHLLNERLERYIQRIKLNPERNSTAVTVVTQNDARGQDIESLPEYREWLAVCEQFEKEEMELAKIKAEIEELRIENSYIQTGNIQLDEFIRTVDISIRDKKLEIAELEERLRTIQMERERLERIRMERETMLAELQSVVDIVPSNWGGVNVEIYMNKARASINNERKRFIQSVNAKEWEQETTSQSFDKNEIRDKIKAEYDARLRAELEKLRAEYNDFYKHVNISTKQIYAKKLAELQKKMGEMTPDEQREIEDILKKLRDAKEKIKQLELQKLELSQRERALGETLEEDEAYWKAKLDEKKKEIAFLESEYASLSFAYEEFSKSGRAYSAEEVKRYSDLIQGVNVKRVNTHAELFYEKNRTSQRRDSSSSSSSSSSSDGGDPGLPSSQPPLVRGSKGSSFSSTHRSSSRSEMHI